ncbi:MAG: NAD-dependent epimerase/dehydratase family protein, partial [Flavitalea sp.]
FGPQGTWTGGKEKAPAAICRKVAEAQDGGTIEVWGDGKQTRSFLLVHECVEAIRRLMESDFIGPVNIGSEEMLSINDLVHLVADVAGRLSTSTIFRVLKAFGDVHQTMPLFKRSLAGHHQDHCVRVSRLLISGSRPRFTRTRR